jgi:hypothetical protein
MQFYGRVRNRALRGIIAIDCRPWSVDSGDGFCIPTGIVTFYVGKLVEMRADRFALLLVGNARIICFGGI